MKGVRAIVLLSAVGWMGFAAADPDFTGTWKLNRDESDARGLPERPPEVVRIEHQGNSIRCAPFASAGSEWSFTIDGKESRSGAGKMVISTIAKWEGRAILVNAIVKAGPGGYTQMDRWLLLRGGTRLRIRREIVRLGGNREGTLVYEKEGPPPAAGPAAVSAAPAMRSQILYVVETGTRIPLVLLNSIDSKSSMAGDRVYLENAFPVLANGRIVIPRGSYVAGTLTKVSRAKRVRGRGAVFLRFDSLTLPNGVTREFRSTLGSTDAEARGVLDREEGKIDSEGNKTGDAQSVGEATAAGASVGVIAGGAAGHTGMGAAIGAAAGAAAGFMGVLLTRGPEVQLPKNSTVEMVLDRKLSFTEDELQAVPGPGTRR